MPIYDELIVTIKSREKIKEITCKTDQVIIDDLGDGTCKIHFVAQKNSLDIFSSLKVVSNSSLNDGHVQDLKEGLRQATSALTSTANEINECLRNATVSKV